MRVIELLQPLILWRKAAAGCGVDNEKHFPFIIGKRNIFACSAFYGKIINFHCSKSPFVYYNLILFNLYDFVKNNSQIYYFLLSF